MPIQFTWTNYQKKIVTSSTLGNNKIVTCYIGPIIDVLLKKWFPLFKVASPITTSWDEHIQVVGKLKHVEKWEFSPKLVTNTVTIHGFSKGPSWLISLFLLM